MKNKAPFWILGQGAVRTARQATPQRPSNRVVNGLFPSGPVSGSNQGKRAVEGNTNPYDVTGGSRKSRSSGKLGLRLLRSPRRGQRPGGLAGKWTPVKQISGRGRIGVLQGATLGGHSLGKNTVELGRLTPTDGRRGTPRIAVGGSSAPGFPGSIQGRSRGAGTPWANKKRRHQNP